MLSPESFGRSHKRHVTDVIRVALERKGIIGFIEIHESMTLMEARTLIWENVENAPCDFQFILDDGVPVSAKQESSQRILHFYPCVKIRECKKPPPSVTSPQSSTRKGNVFLSPDGASSGSSNSTTGKISVWTASGDEFAVWISDEYTFQQLRRDAARYWNLPASQVALADSDGCLWPEQARILSVMGIEELRQRKIILESKGGSSTATSKPPSLGGTRLSAIGSSRRRTSGEPSITTARSLPTNWSRAHAPTAANTADGVNPVEELWRVFTFYCINGDSLELECIKAHQFNKLLRDSRVLGANVTPAIADIIYTAETKGKPNASGKMNYGEFLNALVKVAVARQRKTNSRHLQRGADTQEEDELFQRLVADHILPLASRWPTHVWEYQTQQLRTPEVVAFVSKFLDSLVDIYLFYGKGHQLNATTGVKEFHMTYADYQRFVNDFAFANLQISSVEAAQVFVASCSSTPFHETMSMAPTRETPTSEAPLSPVSVDSSADSNCDAISCSSSSTATAVASAFQKLAASTEGVVLYMPPLAQVGRLCMSVSAFLDVLGRLGLVSFAKTKHVKALQSTKAVFHHLSRGLTRSRVLGIMHNHGSASIHSGRFYSGSVAFNNRFLDMWRYEGSPDYLVGNVSHTVATEKGISSVGLTSPVAAKPAELPLSPSRRLPSSAAMFDERIVSSGAGRGREALDRLVRNAFVRNAIASSSLNTVSATLPRKDDATVPASPTAADFDRDPGASDEVSSSIRTPQGLTTENTAAKAPSSDSTTDDNHVARASDARQQAVESFGSVSRPLRTHLSGGLALHPTDEKVLYESILLKGGVFKKYGQWGNPHRRFVWCSKEFDGVYWRPINKKHSLSKEGIPVVSLMAVLPGNSNRTRYAFMKHLSDEKSLCRCLSVVAEDRRLDLEADSEATRDLWMQAFQFLMKEHRPRTLTGEI